MTLLYKFVLCLILAIDFKATYSVAFLIAFLIINVFWTFYLHMEIGYYKIKVKTTCLRLNYAVLVFSCMTAFKSIRPKD